MNPTSLWLLRHPEPEESARSRCYGLSDVALSAEGVRQAHRLSKALAGEPIVRIYSSPRQRCTAAADILAGACRCAVQRIDAFAEIDFGEFEGKPYDDIAAIYPDIYRLWMERPTEVAFPGGETFAQMKTRVLAAAREIVERHAGESVAVVAHGGVNRIVLAAALGIPSENIFRIGQHYAAVNLIRYFGAVPVVELVNAAR